MNWIAAHSALRWVQHGISGIGTFIIFSGVLLALGQFLYQIFTHQLLDKNAKINKIRLDLGRVLTLGLEFIVAADLISTTTTPDYYTLGILAGIVAIRTWLSYSLTREINQLSKES